jgi:hypothetical protein
MIKKNQQNMKEYGKRKKPHRHQNSCDLYIYISSDTVRHPVTKTFTTLHNNSLHFTTLVDNSLPPI